MSETWFELPADTLFGLDNLPYGVFSQSGESVKRIGVAIGEQVLDLSALAEQAGASFAALLTKGVLNPLLAAGRPVWCEVRARITEWLSDRAHGDLVRPHLLPREGLRLYLPFEVADYVDFYSSEYHALNVGRIFRGATDELMPQWKHLPIGYHGRAGTVVVSGTPIIRPNGQRRIACGSEQGQRRIACGSEREHRKPRTGETLSSCGPSRSLDIEAEVGFVVGTPSELGEPVDIAAFAEHVFGVCLVNDWSARDIQAWEYVPLGPFLGKSFATSISPWVVPLDALQYARIAAPSQHPAPLPYLRHGDVAGGDNQLWGLDLAMEIRLNGHLVSSPPFASQYWTPAQQLAHLTVNGASLRTGDLFASGTVSGPGRSQWGSLLELSWGGQEPFGLPDGSQRTFLCDGDQVRISASAPGPAGCRIGFGEVAGKVLPAR